MRHVTVLSLLTALLGTPGLAAAGALYGTVKLGAAPAAGVGIAVACPTFAQPSQTTAGATADGSGSFSLLVSATGRCEMRVTRDGRSGTPFEVFVSDNPLRFDFEIDNALNRVH